MPPERFWRAASRKRRPMLRRPVRPLRSLLPPRRVLQLPRQPPVLRLHRSRQHPPQPQHLRPLSRSLLRAGLCLSRAPRLRSSPLRRPRHPVQERPSLPRLRRHRPSLPVLRLGPSWPSHLFPLLLRPSLPQRGALSSLLRWPQSLWLRSLRPSLRLCHLLQLPRHRQLPPTLRPPHRLLPLRDRKPRRRLVYPHLPSPQLLRQRPYRPPRRAA